MKTQENLHNLHFEHQKKGWFFSEKWKNKEIYSRQIAYDTDCTETHFLLIDNKLHIYFEDLGTKEEPKIFLLPHQDKNGLSNHYPAALACIYMYETAVLQLIKSLTYEDLQELTQETFSQYFVLFPAIGYDYLKK